MPTQFGGSHCLPDNNSHLWMPNFLVLCHNPLLHNLKTAREREGEEEIEVSVKTAREREREREGGGSQIDSFKVNLTLSKSI